MGCDPVLYQDNICKTCNKYILHKEKYKKNCESYKNFVDYELREFFKINKGYIEIMKNKTFNKWCESDECKKQIYKISIGIKKQYRTYRFRYHRIITMIPEYSKIFYKLNKFYKINNKVLNLVKTISNKISFENGIFRNIKSFLGINDKLKNDTFNIVKKYQQRLKEDRGDPMSSMKAIRLFIYEDEIFGYGLQDNIDLITSYLILILNKIIKL